MHTVDFKKYADIIVNLQMNNSFYYLIKRFDDQILDHLRMRFDKVSGLAFMEKFNRLSDAVLLLQKSNVPPNSDKAQHLAGKFWELINEFTDGDMSLLPKLMEIGRFDEAQNEWEEKQALVSAYLESAFDIYFSAQGVNPFEEGTT